MDILIKGLALPKEGLVEVAIDSDGNVCRYDANGYERVAMAIELPPHGELVQRSDILRLFDENKLSAREAVMKAPSVLEAST